MNDMADAGQIQTSCHRIGCDDDANSSGFERINGFQSGFLIIVGREWRGKNLLLFQLLVQLFHSTLVIDKDDCRFNFLMPQNCKQTFFLVCA